MTDQLPRGKTVANGYWPSKSKQVTILMKRKDRSCLAPKYHPTPQQPKGLIFHGRQLLPGGQIGSAKTVPKSVFAHPPNDDPGLYAQSSP